MRFFYQAVLPPIDGDVSFEYHAFLYIMKFHEV